MNNKRIKKKLIRSLKRVDTSYNLSLSNYINDKFKGMRKEDASEEKY